MPPPSASSNPQQHQSYHNSSLNPWLVAVEGRVADLETGGGGGGGTGHHPDLTGRTEPEQHPQSAITGLEGRLDGIDTDHMALHNDVEDLTATQNALVAQVGGLVGGKLWDDGAQEWTGEAGVFTIWNRGVDGNGDPVGPIPSGGDGLAAGDIIWPA